MVANDEKLIQENIKEISDPEEWLNSNSNFSWETRNFSLNWTSANFCQTNLISLPNIMKICEQVWHIYENFIAAKFLSSRKWQTSSTQI